MKCGECANVTAPGAGFPNHVFCKRFLLHMEKRADASRCRDFVPKSMTNADRIRAMTDEELAIEETSKGGCPHDCETPDDLDTDCVRCWLDWLKSPVKEEK